jgi:hypothetical protein
MAYANPVVTGSSPLSEEDDEVIEPSSPTVNKKCCHKKSQAIRFAEEEVVRPVEELMAERDYA